MNKLILPLIALLFSFGSASSQYCYKAQHYYPGANYPSEVLQPYKDKMLYITPDGPRRCLAYLDTNGIWKKYSTPRLDNSYIWEMVTLGDTVYFAASPATASLDIELYKYDGVNPPTLACDVLPGPNSSDLKNLCIYNNKIYFQAYLPLTGKELYAYDPSTGTASIVKDLYPGVSDGYASYLKVFNGELFFSARSVDNKFEMYSYNSNTNIVTKRTNISLGYSYWDIQPSEQTIIGNTMYFLACPTSGTISDGMELFSMDTNFNVTKLTSYQYPISHGWTENPSNSLGVLNNKIFFMAKDANIGQDFCSYDIATGAVNVLKHMNNVSPSNGYQSEFITYRNKLYFTGDDSVHGMEIWVYDGVNPPALFKDIFSGLSSSSPYSLRLYNDRVYFSATTFANVKELMIIGDTLVTTSVNAVNINDDVNVYPNPASDNVKIEFSLVHDAAYIITIKDLSGRVVYQLDKKVYKAGSNAVLIPVAELLTGTYVYSILDDRNKTLATGKMIKL